MLPLYLKVQIIVQPLTEILLLLLSLLLFSSSIQDKLLSLVEVVVDVPAEVTDDGHTDDAGGALLEELGYLAA